MQPVCLHVANEDALWFNENEVNVLNDLSLVLCDHISLIQQRYHQQNESSATQKDLHHIQGHSMAVAYSLRRNSRDHNHILRYSSVESHTVPDIMSTCSFSLNPLFLRPLPQT